MHYVRQEYYSQNDKILSIFSWIMNEGAKLSSAAMHS